MVLVSALLLIVSVLDGFAQSFVITEFMAANASGERDEDGEFSDWIEIYNPDLQAASLLGWYLTGSTQNLGQWRFPDLTVPGGGYALVFASGKDRRDPTGNLHTNFKLDRSGEYLALVRPDGSTVASEFAPVYPPQATDVSYGRMMTMRTNQWVSRFAAGRFLVPTNNQLGQNWFQPVFDDSNWIFTALGIGYYRQQDPESPPEPGVPLEDVTRPGDLLVPTSANSPGSEGVVNAIDNSSTTKYLNFDKLNAGFTVTLSAGPTVVVGLRLTSANDAPDRDPASYILSGSNDGRTFAEVARGGIPAFPDRFTTVEVVFTNTIAYPYYKLIFPSVRNAAAAVAMQIAEVGFLARSGDISVGLNDFITSNVETPLFGHASAYLRIPFVVGDTQQVGPLTLRVRYDDGFVAFLNGTEVARANAPAVLSYNATAPTNRFRYKAVQEERFDISSFVSLVRAGTNLLAIQGFNDRTNSPDFLLDAQLETARAGLGDTAYFQQACPRAVNGQSSPGVVAAVEASPKRGFFEAPFLLTLSSATPGASIRYTTNGTLPTVTNGVLYSSPIRIDRTTILRATAFLDQWVASAPVTHTFVFLGDVVSQSQATAVEAGFPTNWNVQVADYGLDPRVVGPAGSDAYGGKYAASIKSDLQSLPTLSIVMDMADLFGPQGIYSNPELRGSAWERAASIELLYPDNRKGFQENAGLRVQGGAFRRFDLTLKKSFRVLFRERYGSASLHYPLFGQGATEQFDTFTLRAGANDGLPYGGSGAVYVRDAFAMETARAMGMIASHTTFVHLYLNGQYWGLYNPVERPDAAFSATYIGGDPDNWDAINQDVVSSGTAAAWNQMIALLSLDMSKNENYQRIQGNNPDGTRNPAYADLLNIPSLVDYMILNFYIGNTDWPGRNWWVGRDRLDGDGFHFFPWDGETALDFSGLDADRTSASDAVARPYAAVRANADFKMLFADRVYQHFFNDGPLYVNPTNSAWNPAHPENNRPAQRLASLADQINRAIVGESARWGDQFQTGPYTRDESWLPRCTSMLTSYFPYRNAKVLAQFRQVGLYPKADVPAMNQHGGIVNPGFNLTLSAPQGIIYYTTNGSDPRTPITGLPGQALQYTAPIEIKDLLTVKTRVLNGQEWSALNAATFIVGLPRLGVSELHFHPAGPSAAEWAAGYTDANRFEFIELVNYGTGTCDLNGVQFVNGVHFDFTGSALTSLPASQYMLVVKDLGAFQYRYGAGLPIAGEYTGQLDNAGERITMVDRLGATLIDFTYGTGVPWPTIADGGGPSLEVIDPQGNLNLPPNWHASALPGGSPGKPSPVPAPSLEILPPDSGLMRVRFNGRGGAGYTVLYRDSLTSGDWQVFQRLPTLREDQAVEITIPVPGAASSYFYRVSSP
jgi:hypothetical protein